MILQPRDQTKNQVRGLESESIKTQAWKLIISRLLIKGAVSDLYGTALKHHNEFGVLKYQACLYDSPRFCELPKIYKRWPIRSLWGIFCLSVILHDHMAAQPGSWSWIIQVKHNIEKLSLLLSQFNGWNKNVFVERGFGNGGV